jgi:hypothetical protein
MPTDLITNRTSTRIQEYEARYKQGRSALDGYFNTLDEKEAMLLGKNLDKLTTQRASKSQVNDQRLSTIIWERSARVMAQLPSGKVRALTMHNRGKGELMQMVLDRYILPNANNPQDHLTKFRMLDLYSMVYGSMALLYDWHVGDDYVGPNSRILPIRHVVYQPGKVTIAESEWVAVLSYVTVAWLKKQKQGDNAWNRSSVQYVMARSKESGKDPAASDYRSYIERNRILSAGATKGDDAVIELITFYEAGKDGHWVTFCPDFDYCLLRDIPNPHGNGKIPIILKHCFPLIDSMIGLGDFERGKTLQYAMNSLINLYLDGVKFSLFPPLKVVGDQVASRSSLLWEPGQKWELKRQDAVEMLGVAPQGLQTFESTYSFLIAALLNQNGTTDTARSAQTDPGLGKTPQALKMQSEREGARDAWDRRMMEQTIEDLYNAYIDLSCRKQEKPIKIYLLKDEVANLRSQFPEDEYLAEYGQDRDSEILMHDNGQNGMATIRPDHIKVKDAKEDMPYRFYVDASTTQKSEQAEEHQQLADILMLILKTGPQLFPTIDITKLMEQYILTSGIEDADEIIKKPEQVAKEQQAQAAQAQMMAMQGGQPGQPQPMGVPQPQMTPDGMPAFPGINAPTGDTSPIPTPGNLGVSADPKLQEFIHGINGMGGM